MTYARIKATRGAKLLDNSIATVAPAMIKLRQVNNNEASGESVC
jgi:hypothetical protein